MSGQKFTPGPWVATKVDDQEWRIDAPTGDPVIGHDEWEGLAIAYGCDDHPDAGSIVAQGNARLIAAAPDLLQFLIDTHAGEIPSESHMRDLIAKATGEQS